MHKFKEISKLFHTKEEPIESTIKDIESLHRLLSTYVQPDENPPSEEDVKFLKTETELRAAKYYAYQIELGKQQLRLMSYQKKATFWMKWATIAIAGATLVQLGLAIFKKS